MVPGPPKPSPARGEDLTTLHVQRAREGDGESLSWIVERFSPLLVAQARYRLGPRSQGSFDLEDVVQDVWAIALPRLPSLATREGRSTPVLLRFLGTTLLQHVNNLLRRRALAPTARAEVTSAFLSLPDATRGPITRALASEASALVVAVIDELGGRDRELVILRAIEQHPNEDVAELLGISPNAAAQAYRRALERLRERLPRSVFEEVD